jgi:hypothetical protein
MAAKTSKTVQVNIPDIQIKTATLRIEGTSPLIVHKFSEKARKEILDKCMQKAKSGKEQKNPVMEFIQSLHWLTPMPEEYTEDAFEVALAAGAKFGFPATGLKQSAVSGAYRAGLTKDKVSVYGSFHILGGELVEIQGTPRMREDYATVANGAPEIRYRAEFPEWSMAFDINYNMSVYSLEQIITFFNFGGFAVGLGDWRCEKGGVFGNYRIV